MRRYANKAAVGRAVVGSVYLDEETYISEVTAGNEDRVRYRGKPRRKEYRDRGRRRIKLVCTPIDMSGCPSGVKIVRRLSELSRFHGTTDRPIPRLQGYRNTAN